MSTRAAPYERGHDCASSDTTDGQIWPPGNVSCAAHSLGRAEHTLTAF